MRQNTVQELILKILSIPDEVMKRNAKVELQGCDCVQTWNGEINLNGDNSITLLNSGKGDI